MADEPEPEVIRQQMEVQRAALTEKLETLENKLVETVQGAREAVAETVHEAKEAVHETVQTVRDSVQSSVETVKETFDVRRQVDRHPWAMFGGSVALGFAAGWLLNRGGETRSRGTFGASYPSSAYTDSGYAAAASRPSEERFTGGAAPASPGWIEQLAQGFAPEVQKLKGLAIGAALSVARDLVGQAVPETLRPQ